ncbi:L7Ae/L30e/S12e/Gadd45 family ribosomal protein [Fervidobacterium gondwanense]|uniref:L7Ae/L30e/S12e/Gadd45 family ribosomal protein n=1 Tax=Fervidobacterium gondwanense TaxID=44754 RepID=UPI00392453F5
MDEKFVRVLSYLGFAAKANKIVFGKDMIKEYLNNPKIKDKLLIIAKDAGERVKKDIIIRCDINNIDYFEVFDKKTLAKAVGKKEISVLGIEDENLVRAVKDVLKDQ